MYNNYAKKKYLKVCMKLKSMTLFTLLANIASLDVKN